MKKILSMILVAVCVSGCIHRNSAPRLVVLPEYENGVAVSVNSDSDEKNATLVCHVHPDYLKSNELVRIKNCDLVRVSDVRIVGSMENLIAERLRAELNSKLGGTIWCNTMVEDANITCDIIEMTDIDGKFVLVAEVSVRNTKQFSRQRVRLVNEWPAGKNVNGLLKNYSDAIDWMAAQMATMM